MNALPPAPPAIIVKSEQARPQASSSGSSTYRTEAKKPVGVSVKVYTQYYVDSRGVVHFC